MEMELTAIVRVMDTINCVSARVIANNAMIHPKNLGGLYMKSMAMRVQRSERLKEICESIPESDSEYKKLLELYCLFLECETQMEKG